MSNNVVVFADGGSRGNPGPAGYGAVLMDQQGNVLAERLGFIGRATNNVAEYRGLIAGLHAVAALPQAPQSVTVRMDSKLVVEQMSGRWKIKHADMKTLALQAQAVAAPFSVTYEWVARAQNSAADALANQAMDHPDRFADTGPVEQDSAISPTGSGATGAGQSPPEPASTLGPAASGGSITATSSLSPVAAQPADGYAGDVSARDAWQMLVQHPTAVLVDVRMVPEWNFVGVPDLSSLGRDVVFAQWVQYPSGAVNPDFVSVVRQAAPDLTAPVLCLCRCGIRSVTAARALTQVGYQAALNVLDGFEGPVGSDGHRRHLGWQAEDLAWVQH